MSNVNSNGCIAAHYERAVVKIDALPIFSNDNESSNGALLLKQVQRLTICVSTRQVNFLSCQRRCCTTKSEHPHFTWLVCLRFLHPHQFNGLLTEIVTVSTFMPI